jgi:fructose-specific phosphotransferase system IIA component
VVGLSLSKTDLADTVRDSLEVMNDFFVPFFFIVMGMLVDVQVLMSKEVLIFGGVYALGMAAGKLVGCGLPTLFLNFNHLGTLRIGMGLVPRGELAIIIAGIGLSAGFIDARFFGVAILMVLINNLFAPPLEAMLFGSDRKGTKKDFQVGQKVSTPIEIASANLTELLEQRVIQAFRAEGFFVHLIVIASHNVYHLRKNDTHITLHAREKMLEFESDAEDVVFAKTIAYEALLEINDVVASVKDLIKPESMLKDLADDSAAMWRTEAEIKVALAQDSVIPSLKADTKPGVVEELVDALYQAGHVHDREGAINAVMEREASMSTGMQYGVALPHCRTDSVDRITIAVGLSQDGVDYNSLDGEPSKIFVLILSPRSSDSPHIQFLANVSALLNSEEMRSKLLGCTTQEEVYKFFKAGLGA